MIYLLIILLLLFLIYLYDIGGAEKKKNTFFFIVLLILVLTSGLSYRIGIDFIRYSEDFIPYPNLHQLNADYYATSREDPLWITFTAFFRTFSDNYIWLHLTHAIIINTAILLFIRKYSEKIFTTVLIYFLSFYIFFNFEVLRESLAVSISLMAFPSLMQKKWLKFYLLAFLAFMAHSSAIIIWALPFMMLVARRNIGKLLLISLVLFLILGRAINDWILANMQMLMLNEKIAYKVGVYVGREEVSFSTGFFLKNVFFPGIVFLLNRYFGKPTPFSIFTKLFLLLGCLSMFIPVMDRFLNYLFVYYIINMSEMIEMVVERLKGVNFKLVTTYSIVLFFAIAPVSWYFTIDTRISEYNYHRYYPYHSQFDRTKDPTRERFFENGS